MLPGQELDVTTQGHTLIKPRQLNDDHTIQGKQVCLCIDVKGQEASTDWANHKPFVFISLFLRAALIVPVRESMLCCQVLPSEDSHQAMYVECAV